MARRPLVRDVTRMHVSTAAFQNPIFVDNNPLKGLLGFAPGINPAVLRATDAIVHDVSNAARSISDEYGMINRGEKTMYTADDFSGAVPVYAGTAEKDFYVPREFEENLRTVMGHVSDKWDSNLLTPSVGGIGLNPQYTHEKLVGRNKIYRSQAAMRKAMQEILRRGGMAESAATAKNPYRLTEWLPMSETDYNAAMAAGTLSQATSRLFKGATPDADRMSRIAAANERRKAAERKQIEQQRDTERKQKEQQRINDAAAKAQKRKQQREGRMYANSVWNQFKQQERAEAVKKRQQERQRRLDEKESEKEAERVKYRALVALTTGVTLIIALLRRITQAISDIAVAGNQTKMPENAATDMLSLEAPLVDSISDWIFRALDPLNLISPIIKSAFDKMEQIYEEKMTSVYTGIDMDALRRYNTIDMAHGLGSGTFAGGVISLGQYFSDPRNLDKINLEGVAPVLGGAGFLDDLIGISKTGTTADKARIAEKVIDAYFSNYLQGLNALNQSDADSSRRMTSLVENLKDFSPELAVILRQMINDYLPGSVYAGSFKDYESWAFASRAVGAYDAGVGRIPEENINVAQQIQQTRQDLEALLQNVFDEQILLTYQELLTQILSWVQRVAYKFMSPEQQASINAQNLAKLEEHTDAVQARYDSTWSKVSGYFPGETEESFIKKYFTGQGDSMTTGLNLNNMLVTGALSTDAFMAVTDFLVAARDQQALESELSSAQPVYTASRWTDDYRKMILNLVRKNWVTYGVGASNRNARNNTKVTMGSLGVNNYYGYVEGSGEWRSTLLPSGVVSAYEQLSTTGTLEDAIAAGLKVAPENYDSARWLFGYQTDYIDEFVQAGKEIFKNRRFNGHSFEQLSGYMSGNDITQKGLVVLQGMMGKLLPEQVEALKALALTRLYQGQGKIISPTVSAAYQDAVRQALARFSDQLAKGETELSFGTGTVPETAAAGVTSATDFSTADADAAMRNRAVAERQRKNLAGFLYRDYSFDKDNAELKAELGELFNYVAQALIDKGLNVNELSYQTTSGTRGFKKGSVGVEFVFKTEKGSVHSFDVTDAFDKAFEGNSIVTEYSILTDNAGAVTKLK